MDRATSEDWTRLGHVIVSRINELGITRSDVQDRGGPSPAKIREIVNGRSTTLSPSKRRDLERALSWQSNSIDEVLTGGDATPIDPRAQQVSDDLTDMLTRYVESQPDLPPGHPLQHDTVRALFLAVEDLRDAMIDAHATSPEAIGQIKPALDAITQRLDALLTEHFGGQEGVGAAFSYLMGWRGAPQSEQATDPLAGVTQDDYDLASGNQGSADDENDDEIDFP